MRKKRDRPGPCFPALLQREHHCHGPENTHPLYPSRDRLLHRRRDCEPASALHSSVQYVRYQWKILSSPGSARTFLRRPCRRLLTRACEAPYEDLGNLGSTWNPATSTLPRRPSPASAMVLIIQMNKLECVPQPVEARILENAPRGAREREFSFWVPPGGSKSKAPRGSGKH